MSQQRIGVITNHGALARMEEGNVTNNLRDLFPDTKKGCKIDCETSPMTFFRYKLYQYMGVFLSQSNIFDGFENLSISLSSYENNMLKILYLNTF